MHTYTHISTHNCMHTHGWYLGKNQRESTWFLMPLIDGEQSPKQFQACLGEVEVIKHETLKLSCFVWGDNVVYMLAQLVVILRISSSSEMRSKVFSFGMSIYLNFQFYFWDVTNERGHCSMSKSQLDPGFNITYASNCYVSSSLYGS